jgi:hypothetical protein
MSNIKMVLANKSNKHAMLEWEDFLLSIHNSTPVDLNETEGEKKKRIKKQEADPEEWFKYYFPKYCFAPSAGFQRSSTRRIMRAEKRFYQRRAWARGLAKSTRRMMEVMYLMFAKKLRANALLLSKSNDNAVRLLDTYQGNLEANQRLINDYGVQEKAGKWEAGEFTTRGNCTFRAVGAGQNPRGSKNEELRINILICDDLDDDEVCRNPERVQQTWEWFEQAVIPTVDISNIYYIFVDNNIIAEDSIAVRAAEYADDVELINIRDEYGMSVWPEKNSEEDIDYMLSIISYESGQKEYYNNPIGQGKTFKEMIYGKCPPLSQMPFVVIYGDPSPSNKDKPTIKAKAQNSCKAVVTIGYKDLKFYIYKAFVDHTTNANFIDWLYASKDLVQNKTQCFVSIENNTLQDPFYQQVLLPLIFEKGKARNNVLPVSPDDRDKPDKWFRIEGTLEPKNRMGLLILNEDEKENPHMKRLEAQFKAASANSRVMDGPDAVEGGVVVIQNKIDTQAAGGIQLIKRKANNKRY